MPNENPSALTSMAAAFEKEFPGGVIPGTETGPATGPTGPATGPTGPATGPTGPAAGPTGPATGPTGPATGPTGPATGPSGPATGPTGPATGPTGPATGPTGPATGPTGPAATPSKEQLDAAEKAMDLKAGTAFKFVRGELAAEKEARAADRAKMEQLEAAAGKTTPEVEAETARLRAKVEAQEKELSVSRVESTDEFKRTISTPLKVATDGLNEIAKKYEVTPGALAAAISNDDPATRSDRITELSANFNRFDTNKFDGFVNEIDKLTVAKQQMLLTAADKWQAMQAEQQNSAKLAKDKFVADWRRALSVVFTKLTNDIPLFKRTGDATADAAVDLIKARVEGLDLAVASNDDLVEALYMREAFPTLNKMIAELYAERTTLNERIATLQGTALPAGSGETPVVDPAVTPKTYGSAVEAFRATLPGILPG